MGALSANRSGGSAWSFEAAEMWRRAVQKTGMRADLTPRRVFVYAALLLALAGIASGCGGGLDAQAMAKKAKPPVEYSNPALSFSHPAVWKAYPFRWSGELHFRPLVYLSTQPVHDPCSTKGNTTSCGFPVGKLRPGGVLVTWNASNPPAIGLGRGSRIKVDGREARRVDTPGGICRSIGADRTVEVLSQTRPLPSPLTEMTACLRGPGLAQEQKSLDALLASTKFASQ
jgi:hypothetical protein